MTQADRVLSTPPTNAPVAPTRRRFLSTAAGVAAGSAALALATTSAASDATASASPLTPADASADPIFDLIAGHKKASAELEVALSILVEGTVSPDPDQELLYGGKEDSARWDLATTVPTTLPGLLAALSYVEDVHEGKHSASGRPDAAFAEDDLFNILIGAGDCIRAHLAAVAS
jgi:hypothetical protein